MERFCLMAAMLISCLISCRPEDLTSTKNIFQGGGTLDGPEEVVPSLCPTFFVAGLAYAEGYDWRRDPDYGFAECTMFMESDSRRLASFDVGYNCQVSTDGDMLRCIGTHIYTDFSTDSETVIKCDGAELFRYPGREMIRGLLVRDDGIYTLGVPREGSGWNFRKNGVVQTSSDTGEVRRDLYEDGNDMVFTYSASQYGYYDSSPSYFIVANGISRQLTPPSGYSVQDFGQCAGSTYMLLRKGKGFFYYLSKDGLLSALTTEDMTPGYFFGMEIGEKDVYTLIGTLSQTAGIVGTVWEDGVIHTVFEGGFLPKYIYEDDCALMAVGTKTGSPSQILYLNGEYEALPEGYELASKSCGAFVNGHYCFCMSPTMPGPAPFFIVDGKRTDVDINGWLAGVSYELPEEEPEDAPPSGSGAS